MSEQRLEKLIAQLPNTPDSNTGRNLDEEALKAYLSRHSIYAPNEWVEWLKLHNGMFCGSQGILGFKTGYQILDIETYYELYPEWYKRGWIPVGTDGSGNCYAMSTQQEFGAGYPIFFVDAIMDVSNPRYIVASRFRLFLEFLILHELQQSGWPFAKDEVLQQDPSIAGYLDISLPWHAL